MLGRLADARKLKFVDGVAVEEIVESESEAAFKGGRGAEACAERHIAGENGVETLDFAATFDYLAADAEDISCPLLGGSVLFLQSEFSVFIDVDRENAHLLGTVGGDFRHDDFVDGSGKHESAVIVGVFADEIDTSCRRVDDSVFAESFLEDRVDFLLHEIIKVIS